MEGFHKLFQDCKEIVMIDAFMDDHDPLSNQDILLHPASTTTLDELNLNEKDYLYYWFDFGDDWLHRIRIEKIFEIEEVPNAGEIFCNGDKLCR